MTASPRRITATALLLAPIVWAITSLARDAWARPTGRSGVTPPIAPAELRLVTGAEFRIDLAPDRTTYRRVLLHRSDARDAQLTCRVCMRGTCEVETVRARAGDPIRLDVPRSARSGTLEIRVLDMSVDSIEVSGRGGAPAVEAVQGFSWALPLRSARRVFAALSGADALVTVLSAWFAVLAGVAAVGLWRVARPSRSLDAR